MGIFKKIIGLFKKPPQTPSIDVMRVTPLSSSEIPVARSRALGAPRVCLPSDLAITTLTSSNREIGQLRHDYDQSFNEEIIQAQNDFRERCRFTDEEILYYRKRAKIFYNGNWYNIYPTEIRKRIPVNKDIDPFEEEIWYEDELKTN